MKTTVITLSILSFLFFFTSCSNGDDSPDNLTLEGTFNDTTTNFNTTMQFFGENEVLISDSDLVNISYDGTYEIINNNTIIRFTFNRVGSSIDLCPCIEEYEIEIDDDRSQFIIDNFLYDGLPDNPLPLKLTFVKIK